MKSNIRENGWHIDVTDSQVSNSQRIINSLFNTPSHSFALVVYREWPKDWRFPHSKSRVFTRDGVECASFDMWGNLVVYNDSLEDGGDE